MDFYKHPSLPVPRSTLHYSFVYILAILFSYHTLLVAYNTSSFIGIYLTPTAVGVLHGAGALGAVALFLIFPTMLRRCGNFSLGVAAVGLATVLLLTLAIASHPITLILALVGFLIINPLMFLVIDVFSESLIGSEEGNTGAKRGLTLSLMSAAAVVAPLTMGHIMGSDNDYGPLFLTSAAVGLLMLALLIGVFRRFSDPIYTAISMRPALAALRTNTNVRTVMAAHFLLQLFFAWVVVYVPLYLFEVVGFTWEAIGYIIAAGLVAYVIFEYPIGIIADRYLGEQEMMSVGFVLIGVTVACLSIGSALGLLGFMILMFINRVGASMVEVTTESYFFKQVSGQDAALLSAFRILRPAATVVGALLGAVLLSFVSFSLFFIISGIILSIGVFIPRYLVDTK